MSRASGSSSSGIGDKCCRSVTLSLDRFGWSGVGCRCDGDRGASDIAGTSSAVCGPHSVLASASTISVASVGSAGQRPSMLPGGCVESTPMKVNKQRGNESAEN
jgi:hypothetical protein